MKKTPFFLGILLLVSACRTAAPPAPALPQWDMSGAEFLQWKADDPNFGPDRAVEASGMAAGDGVLWVPLEKYSRILQIDTDSLEARVLEIPLPAETEIEALTREGDDGFLMTDEAHGAVFALDRNFRPRRVDIRGIEFEGSKDGIEGITAAGNTQVFLLLERSRNPDGSCYSTVFPLRRSDEGLDWEEKELILPLEDCNWRLSGLDYFRGHLLALKTRFPGQRYRLVEINPQTAHVTPVLDMTDLILKAEEEGFHGNLEGLAVDNDGVLWIVSDDAMTQKASDGPPPEVSRKSLLLRIPPKGEGR